MKGTAVHPLDESQGLSRSVFCKITVPLLIVMGRLDRLIPSKDAERMVAEAGEKAELWMFEDGNRVNNNIVYRHSFQQADRMRMQLSY